MYKLKTLNKISPYGLDIIKANDIAIDDSAEAPDAILVRSADMNEMQFGKELLCIARAGAGTNNIPVSRCAEEGIVVFNTPGANAEGVKELVVCALLLASRDIVGGVEWVRSIADKGSDIPKMVEKGKSGYAGPEIMGKTLGIVGLGAIGAKIANAALALGMNVYGYDPYLSVEGAWNLSGQVKRAYDLDTIYKNCDYITLHLPYLKDSTHHVINKDAFAKMKDGVRLINLARGELVCDQDLLAAIESGKVARYVTDFPNEVTANAPKTIAIPHLGASTPESEDNCARMAAQQTVDYLFNGNIKNSVNLPAVRLDRCGASRICIIHSSSPDVMTACLDALAKAGVKTAKMASAQRGNFAYTIVDSEATIAAEVAETIAKLNEVYRVRVL